MNRLVFQLADSIGFDDVPHVEISLEEPRIFGSAARPFSVTATEAEFAALKQAVLGADTIKQAGQRLYNALAQHPDLAQHLATALQTQPPQRCPIYVEIATGTGIEALPWETLCSPTGEFLALDERWGLGRIVDSPADTSSFYSFTPPLRIAAILSCLGIEAAGELSALREAIAAAPALSTEVLVVVSEEGLHTDLTAEVAAGNASGIRVEFVPDELGALQRMVAEFKPHVVHFFCHGSAEGSPHLQLAVKSDWRVGTAAKSLFVEAREIREFTKPTDQLPWLVVLNCCESAAMGSLQDLQSLALRLLYEGAAPAVVGMREPVLSDDANLLTRAFYRRLLSELNTRVASVHANGAESIDWAQFVVEARTRLARKHKQLTLSQAAASTKEWTLPVVYIRPTPFAIQLRAADQPPPATTSTRAIRLEIEALRKVHDGLPPGPDAAALRADAAQRIAELTRQLEGP